MLYRKNTLIILSGISGSGKTHFRELLYQNSDVMGCVCPDDIREDFYGDASIQGDGKKVFNEAFSQLKALGKENYDCVFDATNTTKKARKQVINNAQGWYDFIICYYFYPSLVKSINNQKKRGRQVPREVLARQMSQWQTPTVDEGFDYVCELKY